MRILESCIKKLHKLNMPEIIKSLVLIFIILMILDQENLLNILLNYKFEKKNALELVLEKWLTNIDYFEEKNLKILSAIGLSNLIKFENFLLNDIFIGESNFEGNLENKAIIKIISCLFYIFENLDNAINEEIDSENSLEENLTNIDSIQIKNDNNTSEDLIFFDLIDFTIDLKVCKIFKLLFYFI